MFIYDLVISLPPLVLFRCCSSWNLQSSWEKHGSFRSTGIWSWTDRTDIDNFIFKDSCYTLNLLWSFVYTRKKSAVKLFRSCFSNCWIWVVRGNTCYMGCKARGPIHLESTSCCSPKMTHCCVAPNVPLLQAKCDQLRRSCKIKHLCEAADQANAFSVITIHNSVEGNTRAFLKNR